MNTDWLGDELKLADEKMEQLPMWAWPVITGAYTCQHCEQPFEPIRHRWLCPHCKAKNTCCE